MATQEFRSLLVGPQIYTITQVLTSIIWLKSSNMKQCHLPDCTVQEWIDTSAGSGDWNALLALEKQTNTRHLLGLHREPFMFHQANMNYVTAPKTTINGVSSKLSLLQAWVETVTQELVRLTDWPIITLKHDDVSCNYPRTCIFSANNH